MLKVLPATRAKGLVKWDKSPSCMDKLRWQSFYDDLASRILIFDGAMGTMLQARRPTTADYGGPGLDGCNEHLCRTHPDWTLDIHRAYLDAGADIVETSSFQRSSIVLADFGLEQHAHELNVAAARLASGSRRVLDCVEAPIRGWVHRADDEVADASRRPSRSWCRRSRRARPHIDWPIRSRSTGHRARTFQRL